MVGHTILKTAPSHETRHALMPIEVTIKLAGPHNQVNLVPTMDHVRIIAHEDLVVHVNVKDLTADLKSLIRMECTHLISVAGELF